MSVAAYASPPTSLQQQNGNLSDNGEESQLSDELVIPDQDDAQAFLQPAMSSAASHLTSARTPAIEKAAALGVADGGGYFDEPHGSGEDDEDGDTTPEPDDTPKLATQHLQSRPTMDKPGVSFNQLPKDESQPQSPPTPWKSQPRNDVVANKGHSSETRGILGNAFGPTRQRSRSAGQEALKKLQAALPSLNVPTHFLPSLPKSFLSTFTDIKPYQRSPLQPNTLRSPLQTQAQHPRPHLAQTPSNGPRASHGPDTRPQVLRRVTSDDSMLYHSLSRASSLGDDDRFTDVRAMVNIRFMAIKDSLPDVPNFKIPSLAKLQAVSRRSTISLNGFFFNEPTTPPRHPQDREGSSLFKDDSATTPLDRVLEELTGDVVIMGGYRGSVLRSAEPPHQQLWAPVKVGLNMRKVNLELGLDDGDEDTMPDRIIPSGMLKHIGPVDISRKFFKKLRSCENVRTGKLRVHDYGYDWRLSPSRLSKGLQKFLEQLPSNQPGVPTESRGALVIAHSLGGLITRHVVNQRPELFSGVLYCGVPQRCVNILGPLRNGDAVLFNDKLLTAQVNFTIRTSFALLPDDGFCFIDKHTGEEYPVDFFDPDNWVKWSLSPCVAPPLPPHNRHSMHSQLTSFIPNSFLRPRSDSKTEKRRSSLSSADLMSSAAAGFQSRAGMAPHLTASHHHSNSTPSTMPPSPSFPSMDPERWRRNYEYLTRTLASIKKFRSELSHNQSHQDGNKYPPLAVLYGKSIPTVYAARVNGREGIPCSDAYDDLVFRPGDGVVLAKESMLPEGYAIVKGGRVSTERGHITMLGDMPAMGRALEALLKGRRKGIGHGAVLCTQHETAIA